MGERLQKYDQDSWLVVTFGPNDMIGRNNDELLSQVDFSYILVISLLITLNKSVKFPETQVLL